MLRHGSLFSGIGGFDLGFERAGIETAWQVEIDPYCRKVLARHFPKAARYEDIRTVGKHNLEPVDIISGGFPCQDISNAGKRAGIEGERSGLWSEMLRIVCELRPRYVAMENVADLLTNGFSRVLSDLASIGYDAEWDCLQAREFGAPHERERIFLVAYPDPLNGETGMGNFVHRAQPLFAGDHPERHAFWLQAPRVAPGVGNGLPNELYRMRVESVGNAIVPQIAEWIGRRIVDTGMSCK